MADNQQPIVAGQRYNILKYPEFEDVSIHRVKVVAVFENPLKGRIVRYRYNWPLPITTEVPENDFKSWIAQEAGDAK